MGCGPTEVLVGDAPGVARVVAGVLSVPFEPTFPDSAPEGDALTVPLGLPSAVAAFEDGSFYVADVARRRVGQVSPDGQMAWPIGRGACGTPGPGPGDPALLCLAEPVGIAATADGLVYVADAGAHRVYLVDLAAGRVSVALGTGTPGAAADGAIAALAPTDTPVDVALGPDGAVYVAERRNHRVVRLDPNGTVAAFAGTGVAGDSGDGGPARGARLQRPAAIAWLGDTLYVADGGNHRVRRIVADEITAYAGIGAPGFAGDRGPAAAALFQDPGHLAAVSGLLFVADRGNHRIRIIRVGPDSIDTFGGTGVPASGPDLLVIGETAVAGPAGLAAAGRAVFVGDSGGYVVRRVVR
jgi:DNA-binding beta-propeller fold protein YncE